MDVITTQTTLLAIAIPDFFSTPIFHNLVLFFVRVLLVAAFLREAMMKFKDIKGFSKKDGVPPPVAYIAATAELMAAISMATGIMAAWAGLGIALLMVGTTFMHWFKWKSPYWANKYGWEYDVLLLVLGLIITAFGPGALGITL